jgi:hypothetical protein
MPAALAVEVLHAMIGPRHDGDGKSSHRELKQSPNLIGIGIGAQLLRSVASS